MTTTEHPEDPVPDGKEAAERAGGPLLGTVRDVAARQAKWVLLGCVVAMLLAAWVPACWPGNMVDLRVYREAPSHLLTGDLYAFRLHLPGLDAFPLPFTYPPFAAALLLPLSQAVWPLLAAAWCAVSILALVVLTHCCLRMAQPDVPEGRHRQGVLLWSAGLLCLEPVTYTLVLGQINLLLAALVLWTVQRRSPVLAGLGLGTAVGIKLTPAVTVLYVLLHGRRRAALWSIAAFAATVAVGWAVAPGPSREFWFHVLGDTSRVGPVGSVVNQSLRGALSRTLGHDVGWSTPWWSLALPAGLLALRAAVRTARRGDALGCLAAAQLLGLLISPISWVHHWVWAVPAVVWLAYDARRTGWHTAALTAWCTVTLGHVVFWLERPQTDVWAIARPWYLWLPGWSYPLCAVLTLTAMLRPGSPTVPRQPEAALKPPGRGR
ncbi:glycosyltransferase 87 family protein [Streptomyces sp. NPDC057743]|uniref:glycosyltransferase 87 family protein n=1 Tax=Streptomyces sp. NPDC057743 TaxID=3346236 RepID=UPI0036A150EE